MTNPFDIGDRLWNTGSRTRKTIGIVTRIIDAEWCEVLWSDGEGYWHVGAIRRDGTVEYGCLKDREADRIVRVKLSVRINQEV